MTAPQDEFSRQFIGSPDTEEALNWLQVGTPKHVRTLGEFETTAESIPLVQEPYAAGAVQVLAVEIDLYDEGENTGTLLVGVSVAARSREMVLAVASRIAEFQGFDAEPDNGRQYVFVMLD